MRNTLASSSATFSQNRLYPTMQREKSERPIRDIVSSHENVGQVGLSNKGDNKIDNQGATLSMCSMRIQGQSDQSLRCPNEENLGP